MTPRGSPSQPVLLAKLRVSWLILAGIAADIRVLFTAGERPRRDLTLCDWGGARR